MTPQPTADEPLAPRHRAAPSRRRSGRLAALAGMMALLVGFAGLLTGVQPAAAADPDYGTSSVTYSGVTHPPTSDKPQSKLWYNAGSWWSTMWTAGSGWHIYRLDRPTKKWVDTGVLVDSRSTTLTDTLWDGSHLFIAVQVATVSTASSPNVSQTGKPAKLYRYSYSGGTYTLDSGFPSQINNVSSETLTIDEDTTGLIWASWVEITSSTSATVKVNVSSAGGTSWGTPFTVPGAADPNPTVDDISATVAFGKRIGVMWSDENAGAVYFAVHIDGTATTSSSSWKVMTANSGTNTADDHLNLKTLTSDSQGRVYAVLKTSLDLTYGLSSTQPGVVLVTYNPALNAFKQNTVTRLVDCWTRAQIMIDGPADQIYALGTGPGTSVSGCPHSGQPGAIYMKSAPLSSPAFTTGRGTPIIQDGASLNVNDPTTSKQSISSSTGLVVLASNNTTKQYWYYDSLPSGGGTGTAPVASFTATPTSGTAPLAVTFKDTSTGTPTSWSWDFGDGATSTTQNPSHTYSAAGSYPVKLTATNAGGSNTSTATTITVSTGSTGGSTGSITVGASTTSSSSTAVSPVKVTAPTGVKTGDLVVAQMNIDLPSGIAAPTITAPSGWSAVITPVGVTGRNVVAAYSHVVTDAATEPASYSFALSAAHPWNAGATAFSGVNTTTPFDSAAATAEANATSTTVPSVTTATAGALLIGGAGVNSAAKSTTVPTGWTLGYKSTGVQEEVFGSKVIPTAGATGTSTFTTGTNTIDDAAWVRALRPA